LKAIWANDWHDCLSLNILEKIRGGSHGAEAQDDQDLRRGDMVLTYAYRGEGFSAVWFKGRYHSDFDISFAKWPDGTGCGGAHCAAIYTDLGRKLWWAEVKLASGRTGWVEMDLAQMPVSLF